MGGSAPRKELATRKESNDTNAGKGRKRTLTLENGEDIDLTKLPMASITPEVFVAMKARIIELEDQLALASEEPPKKKARMSALPATQPEAGPSTTPAPSVTAAQAKADEKKRKLQLKKIFDRLKKECKNGEVKFQGTPKTIKFEELFEADDFQALFGGHGTLIQPTPTNKPKSTVTIIEFNSTQVATFFGPELKALKGTRWSRGGVPTRGHGFFGGGGGGFSKSVKQGACDVEVLALDVNYSKNGMKCSLKFEVREVGGGGCGYGGYDDDY